MGVDFEQKVVNVHTVKLPPADLMAHVRDDANPLDLSPASQAFVRTEEGKRKILRARRKVLEAAQGQVMPKAEKNTYAGLKKWLEKTTYEAQAQKHGNVDEHTPYVISGFKADSRTQEVMYLVTTLKSLRNLGIRVERGLRNQLCIDTTHRLVSEGRTACLVAGVRDVRTLGSTGI